MTESLIEDWLTLWRSESAAMLTDRELQEWVAGWARSPATAARSGRSPTPSARSGLSPTSSARSGNDAAGAGQPPGAAAPAAASGPGGDAAGALHERIAELERRLAALEQASFSLGSGEAGRV